MPPDSKSNISKAKKRIVVSSRPSAVLNYKATNIVVDLKQKLDKKDMLLIKEVLKKYKESRTLDVLTASLKEFLAESKLSPDDVARFKDFICAEDAPAFEEFLRKL